MTILEKKSARKKLSIMNLVEKGEYSPAYALMLVEQLSDDGKLTEIDYEELASYLEDLLNEESVKDDQPDKEIQEEIFVEEEIPQENETIQEENSDESLDETIEEETESEEYNQILEDEEVE